LGHEGPFFHVGPRRSRGRYGKKQTQVPQKSAKVDILPITIYLVVVLYRHKHCRPQKVELDLACRDSTTTNGVIHWHHPATSSGNGHLSCNWPQLPGDGGSLPPTGKLISTWAQVDPNDII
jgi:hypothetical protein